LLFFLQGAYVGGFVGFVLTITIAISGMIYPPDKRVGSVSIKGCDYYNSTNSTADDGIISKTFVHHRYTLITKAYRTRWLTVGG
jgi:hypothetical protein